MFGELKKHPRLGQWTGRTRSSRSEAPVLPLLRQRTVLARLAVVLLTTLAVTAQAFFWGPPLPYRIGKIYPRDLRVRVYFELINQAQTEHARDEAVKQLP